MEKRKHPRIPFENRVTYILFNEKREKVNHGIGHTLNLSQTGVLLKTKRILEGAFVVLVTMDLAGKQIKIMGKVVASRYCNDSDFFLTGVEFIGQKDEQLEAIKAFIKIHIHRKYNPNG
jgi:hypothetical protein